MKKTLMLILIVILQKSLKTETYYVEWEQATIY